MSLATAFRRICVAAFLPLVAALALSAAALPATIHAEDLRAPVTLDGASSASDNNRFDNLTVHGMPLEEPGTAYVQVVNNTPEAEFSRIDVYLFLEDTEIAMAEHVVRDLEFRSATPFIEVASGSYLVVVTEAGNLDNPYASSSIDAVHGRAVQLVVTRALEAAPQGLLRIDDEGTVLVNENAWMWPLLADTGFYLNFLHSAADLPDLDVRVRMGSEAHGWENVGFGAFTGYVTLPSRIPAGQEAWIALHDALTGDELAAFRFDDYLASLAGGAGTLMPSGFYGGTGSPDNPLDPATFGVLVVREDGTPFFVSPHAEPAAYYGHVQFIHNAPDPDVEVIDLFIDGRLVTEVNEDGTITFRDATPYLPLETSADDPEATREITIEVVDFGHGIPLGVRTRTLTVGAGERHVVVFVGADPGDYDLLVYENARFGDVAEGQLAASFLHGSPDLPPVDLRKNGEVLFERAYYKEFRGPLDIDTGARTIEVWLSGETEEPMFARFESVDFEGRDAETVTLLLSGFTEVTIEPEMIEPDFALMAVFEDGTRLLYEARGVSTEPGTEPTSFAVAAAYPNPFTYGTSLTFALPEDATVRVDLYDVLGRRVLSTEANVVPAGAGHTLRLDGSTLSAGAYLWRLTAESNGQTYTESGRVTVVR
jgi:hypothetical protein